MNNEEAKAQFQTAETLYAQGQHAQALQVLQRLDQRFPNTKNILYPAALCLAGLGRDQDAANLCDRLIQQWQDERAQTLRARLNIPAAGGLDELTLNPDLMLDFDRPRPSRPPVPRPAPNRTPLYAGIAAGVVLVALIAGLAWTGTLSNLLAKLKPETVESAMAKVLDASSKLTSFAGAIQANVNLDKPMPMKISGSGNVDTLLSGDKPMFSMDLSISVEGMEGMNQTIRMVSDGTATYQEMNLMGQTMAMKMTPGGMAANPMMPNLGNMTPATLIDQVKEMGDITLARDVTIEDQPAFVFLVNPKPEAGSGSMPPGLPDIDILAMTVTKATGLPARIEAKDTAGKTLLSMSLKNVVTNKPSSPEKFKYTPPTGVEVMDLNEMAKTGGMMGMPGMPGMPGMR